MLNEKKLTIEQIAELKKTIDIIDISLYDLVEKRIEFEQQINNSITISPYDFTKNLAATSQKITEQRKYNKPILSLTLGLIKLMSISVQNLTIAIHTRIEDSSAAINILTTFKNIFPLINDINFRFIETLTGIITELATNKKIIGFVPAKKAPQKDLWWTSMLTIERQKIKIISKTPLDNLNDETSDYIIANTENYFNFDRSIIVVATSENITNNWLKNALHRLKIPLYNIIDSTAIFNGTVLHLIEISHTIQNVNDPVFKLNETLNNINVRFAGYLGGYFLGIVDKDKVVNFTPTEYETLT